MKIGNSRPYPPTGLSTALWKEIPARWVLWKDLVTTQDGVWLHALLSDDLRPGSDLFPLVVRHNGTLYLEDGHHRVARSVLRGQRGGYVRIYEDSHAVLASLAEDVDVA